MFAIISTGGKQYKVSENTMLSVSKIDGKDGDKITIDDVLFACDKEQFSVGSPQISGAKVNAEIVKQDRDRKIILEPGRSISGNAGIMIYKNWIHQRELSNYWCGNEWSHKTSSL